MIDIITLLKRYPECKATMYYKEKERLLLIVTSCTQGDSVRGVDTDDTDTVFHVGRKLSISIAIPFERIQEAKVNIVLAEVEWAMEELMQFSKTMVESD